MNGKKCFCNYQQFSLTSTKTLLAANFSLQFWLTNQLLYSCQVCFEYAGPDYLLKSTISAEQIISSYCMQGFSIIKKLKNSHFIWFYELNADENQEIFVLLKALEGI